MKIEPFEIKTRVWLWQGDGPAAWHFATIDKKTSSQIKKEYMFPRRGFGSIRVGVKIGKTEWKTSIFPEKGGTYLLPIKRSVRESENIKQGDNINFNLQIVS